MNFKYWYDEVADMPTKDHKTGEWYDAETGLPFESTTRQKIDKFVRNDDIDNSRNFAKQFGGKALTGTAKQKIWGEKIRHSILQLVSKEQAEILCQNIKMFGSAKFWIENRSLNPHKIGELAEEVLIHTKEANRLLREAERIVVVGPGKVIIDGWEEHEDLMRLRQIALDKMESVFDEPNI